MSNNKSSVFTANLPKSKITKDNVTLFPEGALGYLLGPTMATLANSVLASYFNTYMSNVLNINKWAAWFFTWIPAISVVVVIFGNILVGRLMDRNCTSAGKARPLILLSVPISLISLLILFVLSPYVNETMKNKQLFALVLLAVGYLGWFGFAYPMYSTPHAALVSLSTRDSKGRNLLATISNATALASMGVVNMILPFCLRHLFVYQMDASQLPAGATAVLNAQGNVEYYIDANGSAIYDGLTSYNHWKIFAIALMAITAIGAVTEYLFTRERVSEETAAVKSEEKAAAISFGQQMRVCLKDRFWYIMMGFFILYQLGGLMKNVSQLYFCQAMFADAAGNYTTAHGGTIQGTLSIIGSVPTALGMVIAVPLANKIGKRNAIMGGAVLAVAGGVLGLLFPDNLTIVMASFVIKALGSTPAMYLSLALLADVYDHQEAANGFRTDGFTMTIYGAVMAGMTGVATSIMNGVLSSLNYSATNISSPEIRAAMPWLFIGVETICYVGIAVMFAFLTVEKYSDADHAKIAERLKQQDCHKAPI